MLQEVGETLLMRNAIRSGFGEGDCRHSCRRSAGARRIVALGSNKQTINVELSLELAVAYFLERKGAEGCKCLSEKSGHWVKRQNRLLLLGGGNVAEDASRNL